MRLSDVSLLGNIPSAPDCVEAVMNKRKLVTDRQGLVQCHNPTKEEKSHDIRREDGGSFRGGNWFVAVHPDTNNPLDFMGLDKRPKRL